jgi:small conductance mechanosensitive channel
MFGPSRAPSDELVDACGDHPSGLCKWAYERWGNADLATIVDWIVDRPLRIVLIVVAAMVLTRLVRRTVRRFTERLTSEATANRLQRMGRGRAGRLLVDETAAARAKARAQTLASVLTSSLAAAIWVVVALLVVGELGINLAPLIAGAGIAGVALGFGAQSIVRDFLSGMFMIVEDQFGVGDVVDVGDVVGTVERVSMRTTVLRDVNGVVWHVPNGEIRRIGNKSQLWSRAVLDIQVAYHTDLDLAQGVIQRVADEVWNDSAFTGGAIIEPPEVWGVESLSPDGVTLRLVVTTDPADQWGVARELRLRIKRAFDEAGIEIPTSQQTVYRTSTPRATSHPDPATIRVAPVRRPGHTEILPEPPEPDH